MAPGSSTAGYLPLNHSPETSRLPRASLLRFTRNGPSFAILAIALVMGVLGGFVLSSSGRRPDFCQLPLDPVSGHSNTPQPHVPLSSSPITPSVDSDELDLEALRAIVTRTRGYYARDYSMTLGWNNMRYIIETALHHGALLNRTVIIPSFVYARACEYSKSVVDLVFPDSQTDGGLSSDVCAAYATMVNRGDAVNSDEWRELPEEKQMAWKVPMTEMLNLTHLRRTQSVITVAEYLRLHDLPEEFELSTGQWDTEKYHQNPGVYGNPPSLHAIENHWYDPPGLNRVDRIPEDMKERGQWNPRLGDRRLDRYGAWKTPSRTKAYHVLEVMLSGRQLALSWERARAVLESNGIGGVSTDEGLTEVLLSNGWEVLYTFDGALGMDYVKNVVNPIKLVAPRDSIRGFVDDFYDISEDVLFLKGEIHYERKPASLLFTSTPARDVFARLVLYDMTHTNRVKQLAEAMDNRMRELVGGRMWMGAHMRRGDFVRYHWVMQEDFGKHLSRIKNHLDGGREILKTLSPSSVTSYAIPEGSINVEYAQYEPPQPGDKFYIATDERDPGNLAYLGEHGAIRAPDLITMEDRRRFGWPLLLTDVLGIVEQDLLARGSYFYAHALSSVAGGVINMRAANGADPRTAEID
ncbi:hypothetical protein ID866_7110 [Astraeus odoratus]|nr:hypothetical protein ID866_7110 [Astraeus odoratus]